MRFLALTPLQTTLLALLTAATIIALYFLKLRHRRIFVSSSLLWRRVLDEKHAHSLMEKLRQFISIIVAVTIALLIALSLARPEVEALTGKNERIVIVMDTSPTMGTIAAGGRTRWQRAVDEAQAVLTSGGPTTEFRISDTSGHVASGLTTDRNEIRQLLETMKPVAGETQFPKVDATDSLVYFISDGVAIPQVPKSVKRISVFQKAPNVGITAFELRARPSIPPVYDAYLEVQNFGGESTQAEVTISGVGGQRVNRSITLGAEETFQEIFDLTPFEGGGVRATVQSRNDALPADDIAYAYLPVKRRTRTMLVSKGNSYLETLLKVDSFVALTIVDPANFKESTEVDAYIFDRFAPSSPPAKPALIIGAPNVAWLRPPQGVVAKPKVTRWAEDHAVMQFVSVHDMNVERAYHIDPHDLTVLAASTDTPLIVASDKPKWVMLTFDLDSSDFPLHVGFPVFVDNVLAWFSRDQLAVHRQPGTVEIPLGNAQIRAIDGKAIPAQSQLNKTVFEALEPGLYTATQGESRMHIAVNLANRNFSDVNRSAFRNDLAAASEQHLLRRELWFYMLLAAVVLISAEWYTYHKRITL
jgi:Ca-activated chloride channel homolog